MPIKIVTGAPAPRGRLGVRCFIWPVAHVRVGAVCWPALWPDLAMGGGVFVCRTGHLHASPMCSHWFGNVPICVNDG